MLINKLGMLIDKLGMLIDKLGMFCCNFLKCPQALYYLFEIHLKMPDEVGQWKINGIKDFYFRQNAHVKVDKTVSIIADCLASVHIQGLMSRLLYYRLFPDNIKIHRRISNHR